MLNRDFAGSEFPFTLVNTTHTLNAGWFNTAGAGNAQQTAMKNALQKGGAADLNLYCVGFVSGSGKGLLGYATFPWSYAGAPKYDGVVFLISSVPCSTAALTISVGPSPMKLDVGVTILFSYPQVEC